ncbi:hypothetical protein [Pseudovibrio sp. SPO723]|uniref:hypothetical protein n=1 Tax=Nesiotobacter zosterae TaxID=392721 RepID=UPI0029C516BC|nr:hypothetical protein [Pseudovibrio sp. SPO723]MDX5593194.1 hypothetical protein [Pseudovibrio sp. SPO723]
MRAFAELCEALSLETSEARQSAYLKDFLSHSSSLDAAHALALMAGTWKLKPSLPPRAVKLLALQTFEPEFFELSYKFSGDLAETLALMWPGDGVSGDNAPGLSAVIQSWQKTDKSEQINLLASLLDEVPRAGRPMLLRLLRGTKLPVLPPVFIWQALSEYSNISAEAISHVWRQHPHPPVSLMRWLNGEAEQPITTGSVPKVHGVAWQPLEAQDIGRLDLARYAFKGQPRGLRCIAVRAENTELHDLEGNLIAPLGNVEFPNSLAFGAHEGILCCRNKNRLLSAKEIERALGTNKQQCRWSFVPLGLSGSSPDALGYMAAVGLGPEAIEAFWTSADTEAIALVPLGKDAGLPCYLLKRPSQQVRAQVMHAEFAKGLTRPGPVLLSFGVPSDAAGGSLLPIGKALLSEKPEAWRIVAKAFKEHTLARFGPLRELEQLPETKMVFRLSFRDGHAAPRRKAGVELSELRLEEFLPEADPDNLIVLKRRLGL